MPVRVSSHAVRTASTPQSLAAYKIMKWARAYRRRTGEWPDPHSGPIPESPGDTWRSIDAALAFGGRGLHGGRTLTAFLMDYQSNPMAIAINPKIRLTEARVLAWGEAFFKRMSRWPHQHAGLIDGGGGLTWMSVDWALRRGAYGLPGGSSLAKLFRKRAGSPRRVNRPALTIAQILKWADAHHARTGEWPKSRDGKIVDAPDRESWRGVQGALISGRRGFKGGNTLERLLNKHRGVPLQQFRHAPLTTRQILAWADAHRARTGRWPNSWSGPITDAPGETWELVSNALMLGQRGLPGGSSVARLLATERGARNIKALPPLSLAQILRWADDHHGRTGQWPNPRSGVVPDSGGETWAGIAASLSNNRRGLTDQISLAQLLLRERGAPIRRNGSS